MPSSDDDLLARLNALKPSSVQLQQKAPSVDVETTRSQSIEDKLADRLKNLRAGGTTSSTSPARTRDTAEDLTARVKDEVVSERDPIRDWQQQDDDDQTLDDLLADLGSDNQWKLDPDDPKNIQSLMKEAREALPRESEREEADQDGKSSEGVPAAGNGEAFGEETADSPKTEDQRDEAEADDYVKRVLAELEIEKKYGTGEHDEDDGDGNHDETANNGLQLPSAPSKVPDPPTASDKEPPSYEDSELEARFSKLGLGGGLNLPSTPTAKPSAKPKVAAQLKPKSNLPTYTDEDIDSWCCICNEEADVKCIGCDGDLYCQSCWNEGHGTGPGQETGHKAVQYNKKPPKAAA
ncbi:hypothetical protein PRZ48_009717 [Zasmidium cellare]|uniref:Abscission/NoCut checkpoint regulator n=1 Tax=Zasmidium cellare TaxID=395010 RepID=A0ABR0ECG4_ZASCE|nr:hypothetical protein PRZ48_009717 [Zasmidium cellare]